MPRTRDREMVYERFSRQKGGKKRGWREVVVWKEKRRERYGMHTIACKIERVHYRYKKEEEEKWERIEQHVCNDSATAIVVHTTTTISACVRHSSHPRPHCPIFVFSSPRHGVRRSHAPRRPRTRARDARWRRRRLSVPLERDVVLSLPGRGDRRSQLGGFVAPVAESPVLLARGGESAQLAVFVRRVADPVDSRVVPDARVARVHHDHLEILVLRVLRHPIRVEHAHVARLPRGTLFGDTLQVTCRLELRNTLVHGLSIHNTLRDRALPASTAHALPEHGIALLRLVAELACLVWTRRVRHAHEALHLPIFPAADAHQKAHHIALLLLPHLLQVLVRTHLPSLSLSLLPPLPFSLSVCPQSILMIE